MRKRNGTCIAANLGMKYIIFVVVLISLPACFEQKNTGPATQSSPGSIGPNGAKGEQGIQGVQGISGPKGDKGDSSGSVIKAAGVIVGEALSAPFGGIAIKTSLKYYFMMSLGGKMSGDAIYFPTNDCSGQAYATADTYIPGGAFQNYAQGAPGIVYYVPKDATAITFYPQSWRPVGSSTPCRAPFTQDIGPSLIPVVENDPAVTGIPGPVFALPITIE